MTRNLVLFSHITELVNFFQIQCILIKQHVSLPIHHVKLYHHEEELVPIIFPWIFCFLKSPKECELDLIGIITSTRENVTNQERAFYYEKKSDTQPPVGYRI